MNMFYSIDFGQRNQEPQVVLFNHITIELLNRDIITCSNFNLTEKKIWKQFLQRKDDRKKETFFQKCEFTEEKLLVRYSSGGQNLFEMSNTYQEDLFSFWLKKIAPSLLCAAFLNDKRKKENVRSGKVQQICSTKNELVLSIYRKKVTFHSPPPRGFFV